MNSNVPLLTKFNLSNKHDYDKRIIYIGDKTFTKSNKFINNKITTTK